MSPSCFKNYKVKQKNISYERPNKFPQKIDNRFYNLCSSPLLTVCVYMIKRSSFYHIGL